MRQRARVCVRARVCMCVCVSVCMCVCDTVCVCVRAHDVIQGKLKLEHTLQRCVEHTLQRAAPPNQITLNPAP